MLQKPDNLKSYRHLGLSAPILRRMAGAFGCLLLIQCGERPERAE